MSSASARSASGELDSRRCDGDDGARWPLGDAAAARGRSMAMRQRRRRRLRLDGSTAQGFGWARVAWVVGARRAPSQGTTDGKSVADPRGREKSQPAATLG